MFKLVGNSYGDGNNINLNSMAISRDQKKIPVYVTLLKTKEGKPESKIGFPFEIKLTAREIRDADGILNRSLGHVRLAFSQEEVASIVDRDGENMSAYFAITLDNEEFDAELQIDKAVIGIEIHGDETVVELRDERGSCPLVLKQSAADEEYITDFEEK